MQGICTKCKRYKDELSSLIGVNGVYCTKCIRKGIKQKTICVCAVCKKLIYVGKNYYISDNLNGQCIECFNNNEIINLKPNEIKKITIKKYRTQLEYFKKVYNTRSFLELKQINNLSDYDWNKCKEYFNNSCAYCGANNTTLHKEHVIPLSKGGNLVKENIIPSCQSCNSSKGTKLFHEWYKKYKHYSVEREEKIIKYLNKNK